ncbi:unnamed protein product [Rotaria sp. Silwood1]|nr:unnamed protein product [Rotaria sp. Silwood1]
MQIRKQLLEQYNRLGDKDAHLYLIIRIHFVIYKSGEEHLFINEFRQKLPLTTYENYREYVGRMVNNGEKHVLPSNKIIYFATSSGTTGKMKLLPITSAMAKRIMMLVRLGQAAIWRSFPESLFPAAHQRLFRDVDTCTRFLSEADDAVLLAFKKTEIPRIPLISIAYRTGNLLSISGENTTEQHVMITLRQTVQKWKQHGIYVDINDFILYPKLDAFPARYVMFLELVHENSQHDNKVINQQQKILQNNEIMSEIEQQLCEANHIYKDHRDGDKLDPITCILVRTGTFSIFLNKILVNTHVSIVQIVPHRVLKNEEHIQFFYDSRIVNPN